MAALKWSLSVGTGAAVVVVFTAFCLLTGAMLGSLWRTTSLQRPNLSSPLTIAVARPITADVWMPPPGGPARAPLIVYMPSWGGLRSDNLAMLHALCQRGYIVIATDDIAHDRPYADPDDEAARTAPYDLSSDDAVRRFIASANRRVVLQAQKVRDLLDGLTRDPDVRERIDFERAGMLGGSFGGATAALLGRQEPRFKALANLDGWQFGPGADDIIGRPYLVINSSESRFTERQLSSPDSDERNSALLNAFEQARQSRQAAARDDTYRYLIVGGSHNDLTDALHGWRRFAKWWIARPWGGPMADAVAMRRALDDIIGTFFDIHVRGADGKTVRAAAAGHAVLIDLGPAGMP